MVVVSIGHVEEVASDVLVGLTLVDVTPFRDQTTDVVQHAVDINLAGKSGFEGALGLWAVFKLENVASESYVLVAESEQRFGKLQVHDLRLILNDHLLWDLAVGGASLGQAVLEDVD